MRVLVAGATSVPGLPLLRELRARGHDVFGMTRSADRTAQIAATGADPVVADVFDTAEVDAVIADIAPEAVVSLLTTLPKYGPLRARDFEPATKLWSIGAPNLVAAAKRAGVPRVVAESVIFAYGYPPAGPPLMDESDPYPGPPPPNGAGFLGALRAMEQTVLSADGIVLRYGVFYGPGVTHDELFRKLARFWAVPALTGDGILSWVHIDDVARATADAVEKGRPGQIYNVVDDRPQSFGDYIRELNARLGRPKPWPISSKVVGLVSSYPATAFGNTWLPLSNAKAKAELGFAPIPR
ncbi:NAD(P)-dependent oxidoreductase [Mycobacterium sp. CPCC 205372]|uniref:NAD(P)-dependent oxidoreductase n=1 Tax=Mycobacterium hippophais TaxID=3016340 RepID=A0ABT4PZ39_9MYCO|nr:NAD(P)-dependent oxidoreductase [Mycobacterium hippophais]MCZ8381850.1 NAD(P)-dependent oxidoreductase [Mycobacterium hippophais]